MALPEQVVNDARLANAMIAGVTGKSPGPESPGQYPSEDVTVDAGQQPQPAAPKPEISPDQAGVEHDWKERFSKLKSTHDATTHQQRLEIERLRAEQQALQEQLAEQEVNDLKAGIESPVRADDVLNEEDIDLFGSDNLEIVTKIVNHVVGERLKNAVQYQDKRLESIDATRAKQNAQQAEIEAKSAKFKAGLTDLVPDWLTIDDDPMFKTWVEEADETSGVRRLDLMINAFQALDIARVAEFYTAFKATKNPPDPRERQLLPDTGRIPSPPHSGMPPGTRGKIWTQAEIGEFYKLRSLGRFRGRDAEARAIEADIFAAQKEGRIR